MKFTQYSVGALTLAIIICGSASSAHAWGRKLNVQGLAGTYDYVATPDTSLACPEVLTVTYDENTSTLDSAIFHLAYIFGGGPTQGTNGIETDADHAAYYDYYNFIQVKAHSIVAEKGFDVTTSDMSNYPQPNSPYFGYPAGSEASMHLQTFRRSQALEISYNEKKGILKKSVVIDGSHFTDNCSYQKR